MRQQKCHTHTPLGGAPQVSLKHRFWHEAKIEPYSRTSSLLLKRISLFPFFFLLLLLSVHLQNILPPGKSWRSGCFMEWDLGVWRDVVFVHFKANSMHKSSVVCWKCCHDMPKCTIFNRVVGLVLASYNSVLWKIWIDLFGWNACNVRTLHTIVTLPPSPPQRTSRVMYECNNRCVHAYPKNWDGKSEKKIARFTWAQHTFLPSVCVCVSVSCRVVQFNLYNTIAFLLKMYNFAHVNKMDLCSYIVGAYISACMDVLYISHVAWMSEHKNMLRFRWSLSQFNMKRAYLWQ